MSEPPGGTFTNYRLHFQDGQVFVLGSPEPTTVLEIVTDESPESVVNRLHSNQLEIVTEEPPQTVVETTTISIATTQ